MAKYDVSLVDSFTVYDDDLKGDAFAKLIKEELESRFRNGDPLTFRATKILESGMKEPVPEIWVTIGD